MSINAAAAVPIPNGVEVIAPTVDGAHEILTPEALEFLGELHRTFEDRRQHLLTRRVARQRRIDQGERPTFLYGTASIRAMEWTVAPIPADLVDRRVEITGPVTRKMIINAFNSGANVFMADFEDSNAPTWSNNIEGQINLRDAVRRQVDFTTPEGKHYALQHDVATLFVRPRGWHLNEKHASVAGVTMSASLFDFGLFFFHNAAAQLERGTAPYFYLPKLENHLEARLWNEVFVFAQEYLGLPSGTIRATVLIENILAAFEMDEILYELRDHSAGLNCGRWDYIFSFLKTFRSDQSFVLPDRSVITMDRHFLNAYVELLIRTCHRRGIHAMGGMAAQIPNKHDPDAHRSAIDKVRRDKLREVQAGHDGTWVAHPGLVSVAREVFDANMTSPNQIHRLPDDAPITADDLLAVPDGRITHDGLRHNVDVGLQYVASWLAGLGCVPIHGLMEDAATAEISRSQLWQWVHHRAELEDGRTVTAQLIAETIQRELQRIRGEKASADAPDRLDLAADLFATMTTQADFAEWLTVLAYKHID